MKNTRLAYVISILLIGGTLNSCDRNDIEELVTFNGHLYIYDFENNDPNSDWLPLTNREISIYFIDDCTDFTGKTLLGTVNSNDKGYYELEIPLEQTAVRYLSNGEVSYVGCHYRDTGDSYLNYKIIKLVAGTYSEQNILTGDFYFSRETKIFIETNPEKLDSVFVKIENSNSLIHELISSSNIVFYREEFQRPWWNVLGNEFSRSLPYDPNSTYELSINKYSNGELDVENFDFDLSLNQEENIVKIE